MAKPLTVPEIEAAIVHVLLACPETQQRLPEVPAECFTDRNLRAVVEAAKALHDAGKAADLVTLSQADLPMEPVAKVQWLTNVARGEGWSWALDDYLRDLRDAYRRRMAVQTLQGLTHELVDSDADTDEIIAKMAQAQANLSQGRAQEDDRLPAIMAEAYNAMARRSRAEDQPIRTGFTDLDDLTGGIARGEMWLLGARPSVGKSALAAQMATEAVLQGKSAVFFSLEMSREMIAQRYYAQRGLPTVKARTGALSEKDWEVASEALKWSSKLKRLRFDRRRRTPQQMRTYCRQLVARQELDLVVVDYMQLARPDGKAANRNLEVAQISWALKELALELDVPVIALSQLSRAPEMRMGKEEAREPGLADLRDSGALEQDADLVGLMFALDQSPDPETQLLIDWAKRDGRAYVRLKIAKARQVGRGVVDLIFDGGRMRFTQVRPEMYQEAGG